MAKASPNKETGLYNYEVVADVVVLPGQVTLIPDLFRIIFLGKRCSQFHAVRTAISFSEDRASHSVALGPPHEQFEPLQSIYRSSSEQTIYFTSAGLVRKTLCTPIYFLSVGSLIDSPWQYLDAL